MSQCWQCFAKFGNIWRNIGDIGFIERKETTFKITNAKTASRKMKECRQIWGYLMTFGEKLDSEY